VARVRYALIAGAAVLAALAAGPSTAAREPDPAPLTLRFVTFNLRHGGIFSELTGDDDGLEDRLGQAIEGLRALDADVVGLQEASTGRRRGNVPARLAAALGYRYVYTPAAFRPFGSEHIRRAVAAVLGFTEGPALLSRLPIVRWTPYQLPPCGRPFDVRVVIFAELETAAGRLPVFSAHTSRSVCHTQAVAALVRAHAGPLPAVVMGDFNAEPTSPVVETLAEAGLLDAYAAANPGVPGFTAGQVVTSPHSTVDQRLDYVWIAPGQRAGGRVIRSRVVLDDARDGAPVRWASDHYGVLADIALADPRPSRVAGVSPPLPTEEQRAAP
jgi:endonuclease/exonuclease/phosphatase family metal-dependent hydrolase